MAIYTDRPVSIGLVDASGRSVWNIDIPANTFDASTCVGNPILSADPVSQSRMSNTRVPGQSNVFTNLHSVVIDLGLSPCGKFEYNKNISNNINFIFKIVKRPFSSDVFNSMIKLSVS